MPSDPSMIVAVVSLFVAVLAALFTAYQAIISRQHNKMSVRPYLTIDRTFWLSRDGIYTARMTLENTGLGPAIVNCHKLFFDLNELGGSDELQICIDGIDGVFKKHRMSSFERYMFSSGQVIPPGKKTRILATNMEAATKETGKPLWVLIKRFDLYIAVSYTHLTLPTNREV